MVARRMLSARHGSTAPPTVAEAERDVATARAVVEGIRRLVSERKEGAASLATAEYRLNAALRQLDRAREAQRYAEPPDLPPEVA